MKITYAAWLGETIGIDHEVVSLPADIKNIGMLVGWLAKRGPQYERAFEFIEVVKIAVNQECVDNDHAVEDDDEVLFFPPIAGG